MTRLSKVDDSSRSNIRKMLRLCKELRFLKNKDTAIVITGSKGAGKSHLAYTLCMEHCKLFNKKFDFEKNVIYTESAKETIDKVNQLEEFDCLWFDESARFILAENWANKHAKELKKVFSEIRTKKLLLIFVLPFSFKRVDTKYRESLLDFWIYVQDRDLGICFQKIEQAMYSGFNDDFISQKMPYVSWLDLAHPDLKKNNHILVESKARSIPNYFTTIHWNAMASEVEQEYLKYRDDAVYNRYAEDDDGNLIKKVDEEEKKPKNKFFGKDYSKNFLRGVLNLKERGTSVEEIGRIMGVASSTLKGMLDRYNIQDNPEKLLNEN
jgi:hypothetical protein